MSIFDDNEYSAPEATQGQADAPDERSLDDQRYAQGPEDPIDDDVREAEERLKEVGYYRSLMEADLFGDPGDPVAARVQDRLRVLFRHEMVGILRGERSVDAPKAKLGRLEPLTTLDDEDIAVAVQFLSGMTAQEAEILRAFIKKIISDPTAIRMFLTPQVRTVTVKDRPAVRTAQVERPRAPQVAPVRQASRQAPAPRQAPPRPEPREPAPQQKPVQRAVRSNRVAPEPLTGPQGTQQTKVRSPHSQAMPKGNALLAVTAAKAGDAADAGRGLMPAGIRNVATE